MSQTGVGRMVVSWGRRRSVIGVLVALAVVSGCQRAILEYLAQRLLTGSAVMRTVVLFGGRRADMVLPVVACGMVRWAFLM